MKKITKLALLPLAVMLSSAYISSAVAAGNDCDAKRDAIEAQIKQAERFGNHHKVAGLKQALAEVKAHCTNSGLVQKAEDKVKKLERKLDEQKEDIREVQADLKEAQSEGDTKKVLKYQRKLAEERADLQEIQDELKQARSELAGLKG